MIDPLPDDVIEERRSMLRELLIRLADGYLESDSLKDAATTLSEIYADGYRQMYSEIFPTILGIYNNSDNKSGLDILTENMETLRGCIKNETEYDPSLYGKVLKLSDHINLEVQRLRDYEGLRQEASDSVAELSVQVEKAKRDIGKARDKARRMQTEVIVILGIFTAIVMTVSGGLTLMGSSLEGMSSTGPYKIAFVVLICGVVLFNIIAFLMTYINRMISELYADSEEQRLFHSISRAISNNVFIIIFNIMLFVMLGIDLYFWSQTGSFV